MLDNQHNARRSTRPRCSKNHGAVPAQIDTRNAEVAAGEIPVMQAGSPARYAPTKKCLESGLPGYADLWRSLTDRHRYQIPVCIVT
jgi:hypothetical protein